MGEMMRKVGEERRRDGGGGVVQVGGGGGGGRGGTGGGLLLMTMYYPFPMSTKYPGFTGNLTKHMPRCRDFMARCVL